jgi:capsular polysaccharide transport system permease protein
VDDNLERSSDAGWLERAIAAGDLEACLAELSESGIPPIEQASLYCRLGEAFYYRQQYADAAACADAAFELAPASPAIADFCAWCFSNCGQHRAAAAAYERLLESRPGWAAGHRHASGSFAIAGEIDRAIQHGARAAELEPNSAEFATHAGCLLAGAGLHRNAVGYFSRAEALASDDAAVLRHHSGSAFALGERETALALAQRACELAPGERAHAHHATELLLRCDRLDEAVELISARLAGDPKDAVGYRLLSAAETLRGRIDEALSAVEQALALVPAQAEYHQHRGNLLHRLARFDEAAEAFDRAAALEPDNPAPRRSQLTVYYDSGKFREALAIGGELIRIEPDNEEYAQAVLQILNRRFETLDGDYIVLGERPAAPPRSERAQPSLAAAAHTQWRVICALIIRETRTRFGDSTLGYGWALLEPILHILMLSLVFAVLMHGRPPIGTQFFIFYYTGIIPYHLFVHTSSSMTYAVSANGSLLQLPLVGTFDVLLARGLLELVTDVLVAAILLAGFGAIGLGSFPYDAAGVAAASATVWLLGCGCGFINAVVNAFFRSWDKIWAQLTRILYFCSGIFYVPGMMPDWIRDRLAWNPVLQAVDWFRASFFDDYLPHWLDRGYLLAVAGSVLLAGLALERGLRRRLYEPS